MLLSKLPRTLGLLGIILFPTIGLLHASENPLTQFAFSPKWLKALHYEKTWRGYKSRIDHQPFFFAANGQTSPQDELQAFVSTLSSEQSKVRDDAACAFPYRTFLVIHAGLAPFNKAKCDAYDFFRSEVGVHEVSMIFVGQYADDPASMLGHMFMQFHHDERRIGERSLLYLDKTFNYAAMVPENTNILKYITFGIFGGFDGRYSQYSYDDMLEKYNNMEGRDLFSYKLHLSRTEISHLVAHSWELINSGIQDYFFFDENCAFQLLAAVDAVLPDHDLLHDTSFYVAPLDVLKILAHHNLIRDVSYTPSIYQRIQERLFLMTLEERELYKTVRRGKNSPTAISTPLVAETLIEDLNFTKHKKRGVIEKEEQELYKNILKRRAELGTTAPPTVSSTKHPPHESHGPTRFALGGTHLEKKTYTRFQWRPVFHDLLSQPDGFEENSAIVVLESDWIFDHHKEKIYLRTLKLLELAKLKGAYFEPAPNWHAILGWRDLKMQGTPTPYGQFDVGYVIKKGRPSLNLFLLLSAEVGESSFLERPLWELGVKAGFIQKWSNRFRSLGWARILNNHRSRPILEGHLSLQQDLSQTWDLRFELNHRETGDQKMQDIHLGVGLSL